MPRLRLKHHISLSNKSLPQKSSFYMIIRTLPVPFILMWDFNSHSTSWGGNNGTVLEEVIQQKNLVIMKPPTHFNQAHRTWSMIDLIIASLH